MANKKFTELSSIDSSTIAGADVFAVTDISANESKKITLTNLQSSNEQYWICSIFKQST